MKNKFISIIYVCCISCVSNAAWKEAEAVLPETYSGTSEYVTTFGQTELTDLNFTESPISSFALQRMSLEIPDTETSITPEIEAMARALKYNVVDIYRYVHNYIDYVPTYGLYNGATGCFLAGRGNDWDQAALLIALLRASGYTARFGCADVVYPDEALVQWLGIENPNWAVEALSKGGCYVGVLRSNPEVKVLKRVWAEFLDPDSQSWITLDPAYTVYKRDVGVDLKTAMGYQGSTFISEAITGATVTSDFVEHLNEPLIRNQLTSYSTNLANFIKTEYPNARTDDMLGREYLTNDTLFIIGRPGSIGYFASSYTNFYQAGPNDHLKIQIEHAGIDESLYGYEIAGKRVTLFYNSEDGNKPELRIDGNLIASGTSTSLGSTNAFNVSFQEPKYTNRVSLVHPFGFISGGQYLLMHDFQSSSEMITELHNKALLKAQFENAASNSEEIVGGGMQITMDAGLAAYRNGYSLLADLADVSFNLNYFIGVLGLTEHGYYVDLPMSSLANTPRSEEAAETPFFEAALYLASGLEHAILEQSQGSNQVCVSTVKLLQLNNEEGGRTYLANSTNWSSISNSLVGYSLDELLALDASISAGKSLLLPYDGELSLLDWYGYGYAEMSDHEIKMMIDGGYSGGYGAGYDWEFSVSESQLNLGSVQVLSRDVNLNIMATEEPINLHTGDYFYDNTDLSFDDLSFSRHYNSGQSGKDGSMGYGWTHGYEISARKASHSAPALGTRRAEDAASLIVAGTVLLDLLEGNADVTRWTTAILASKWAVDQLIENAVCIQLGPASLEYIRHPDGTYSPPPGETADLVWDNDHFVLQKRFGEQLVFNPDGTIASWTDADEKGLSFGYNSSTNLQTISDSYGRSLTLGYTDGLLSSVTDSSGRSVGYGYSDGNLTAWTDAESEIWSFDYTDTNNPHLLTVLTDPMNQITASNSYNRLGQVETQRNGAGEDWEIFVSGNRGIEQDPEGGMMQYHFDENGRCVSTEDELHIVDHQFYDGEGHPIYKYDANLNLTRFKYDANHNLTNRTDALTNNWVYIYDAAGHLTDEINPLGQTTHFDYDANHHLSVVTDPLNGQTVRTYYETGTSKGLIHTLTDPNGNITTYTYDSYGNPDVVTYPDLGSVNYDYNARGELCKETDARGNETTYSYNDNGKLLATQYQDGSVVSNSYWANGLLRQTVDAKGQPTIYTWTPTYKLETVTYPNGGVVSKHYNSRDWLVAVTDMRGHTVSNLYDIAGRKTGIEDALGYLTEFQMDQNGNITNAVIDPEGLALWTVRTFDDLNRPTIVQTPLSRIENQYDALGRATNRIDAAYKEWATEYDALGRVRKTFRPSGNHEEYGYDANGNRTHFWNAESKPMSFGFDAQGHVTSITNAINKITNFGYDGAGNLAWRVMPDQDVTSYGYDGMNRLSAVTNNGYAVGFFGYDRNGNTVAHASPLASGSLGYDAMNHLIASTQTVNGVTTVVNYGFDLNGNRTGIVYPGGLTVGYVYGDNDRIEHVTTTYGGNSKTFSFSYDGANRLNGISYPNGINSTFGLDAEGRVTSIVHGNFINRTIQRNALGFKDTELIDAGLKPTVPTTERRIKTHNDADQLISEQIQSGDNWTQISYGYNANGCLTNILANGVETKKFGYNYDNMLTSVDSSAGSIRYLYDALGARVGRIDGSVTHYFVTDQGDALKRPLAETDASGNIIRFYVWNGSQLLCHIDANGAVRYYHADELGSTLALTDAAGNVTDQFAYMPYGYATHTGSTSTPFQWLGGYGVYYDSATDLHLTLHRAYSSTMKRFIHPDPLGIDGGANVYVYANQNPLFFVDPSGEFGWIGALIGGGLDLAAQLIIEKKSLTEVNYVSVAASAVSGAMGAGLGANVARLTTSIAGRAVLNAAGSAAIGFSVKTVENAIEGKPLGTDVIRTVAVNGVFGGAGSAAGDLIERGMVSIANQTPFIQGLIDSGALKGNPSKYLLPGESLPPSMGSTIGTVVGIGVSNLGPFVPHKNN